MSFFSEPTDERSTFEANCLEEKLPLATGTSIFPLFLRVFFDVAEFVLMETYMGNICKLKKFVINILYSNLTWFNSFGCDRRV